MFFLKDLAFSTITSETTDNNDTGRVSIYEAQREHK